MNRSNIAVGSIFVLFFGCSDQSHDCAVNMGYVESAAKSFALQYGISSTNTVDPEQLSLLFKDGRIPKCPQSGKPYPPFSLTAGPKCAANPTHNEAFEAYKESGKK